MLGRHGFPGEQPSGYDVAQICIAGHVSNDSVRLLPQFNVAFCSKCGQPTVTACPSCSSDIRGNYHTPGIMDLSGSFRAPAYCVYCGKPFPWTVTALEAAREFADELKLGSEDIQKLKDTFQDLTVDSARTPLAASRFKRFMDTVGKPGATALTQILVSVLTEEAKKQLGLK